MCLVSLFRCALFLKVLCLNFNDIDGRLIAAFTAPAAAQPASGEGGVTTAGGSGGSGGAKRILPKLQVLALQSNRLSGPVPSFGEKLCPRLKILHVSSLLVSSSSLSLLLLLLVVQLDDDDDDNDDDDDDDDDKKESPQ